jgi:hypothetical protein
MSLAAASSPGEERPLPTGAAEHGGPDNGLGSLLDQAADLFLLELQLGLASGLYKIGSLEEMKLQNKEIRQKIIARLIEEQKMQ